MGLGNLILTQKNEIISQTQEPLISSTLVQQMSELSTRVKENHQIEFLGGLPTSQMKSSLCESCISSPDSQKVCWGGPSTLSMRRNVEVREIDLAVTPSTHQHSLPVLLPMGQ